MMEKNPIMGGSIIDLVQGLNISFEENLKVKDYKYLDEKRAKKILFNI